MEIRFDYYHFGPFLYKTKLTEEKIKDIVSICEKEKGEECRDGLAGHLSKEYELPTVSVMKVLHPYFASYCKALYELRGQKFKKNLIMTKSWVNYMSKGEFNPPHTHSNNGKVCDLSCVLYLDVPKDLLTDWDYVPKSSPPGSIVFSYGEYQEKNINFFNFIPEIGDLYIFPGWLIHYVFPFTSKGTRISLSANLVEEQ